MPEPAREKRQPAPAGGAIRVFLRDEKTGDAVPGVVVSLYADTSRTSGQLVATLQTDHEGYASFKLEYSLVAASTRFRVTHGAARDDALVVGANELLAGAETHTLTLDASQLDLSGPSPGLPAVVSPDALDLALSPGSIGLIPHFLPGKGLCGQLMPTTMAVRRFQAFRIIADICKPQVLNCGGERVQYVRGRLLEYEVAWHPAGTALGELLNTITLAPCEQVNVAVADWMRRETATLERTSDVRQHATQEMDHDRLVRETMRSSVFSASVATAAGGTIGIPLKLNLTVAFGAGISASAVAASTASQLSERITQASSFVASQRQTVVFQATATERSTYQTRTIRNHNHCHTLNLMYYGVNRVYRVVTDYKGEREVILVKYENRDFDAHRAYCGAHVLKDALLDPSLAQCFDELGDALFCCGEEEDAAGKDVRMESITVSVNLAGGSEVINQIHPVLQTTNGPLYLTAVNVWWHGSGVRSHTFTLPGQVDPAQVTSVLVIVHYAGSGFAQSAFATSIDITYHAVGLTAPLALASRNTPGFLGNAFTLEAKAELPPVPEGGTPCADKSCCVKKLLAHLNCHKRYYNSLLWMSEDPNERVARWSCCLEGETGVSLIVQIENEPLAVHGDFVAFAVAGTQLVDDPTVLPVSRVVTLPTPGVYAEGVLGHCDTCEIIDPARHWNWKDSPCPDNAPELPDPADPQKGPALKDLLPDAITSLVTFASVPGAPASGIADLVKTLVASADAGSKEAKALLEKLLDTLKASIPKST
jgi:hypothetical protein